MWTLCPGWTVCLFVMDIFVVSLCLWALVTVSVHAGWCVWMHSVCGVCMLCVWGRERFSESEPTWGYCLSCREAIHILCVCARTHVHALAYMCMCVFLRGRDFQKVNLLGVISLTSERLCTLSVFLRGRDFQKMNMLAVSSLTSATLLFIFSVFLSVCVYVFTWVSSVKLCMGQGWLSG